MQMHFFIDLLHQDTKRNKVIILYDFQLLLVILNLSLLF